MCLMNCVWCSEVLSFSLVQKTSHTYWARGRHNIFIGTDKQAYGIRKVIFKCKMFIDTRN